MTEQPTNDPLAQLAAQQPPAQPQQVPQQNVPVPGPNPSQQADFLGDLGLTDVPEGIKAGKYPAVLAFANAAIYDKKDGSATNQRKVTFNWRVDWPGSEFNGELIENDFCHANPGMDNRDRRKLRDRLVAIGAPLAGVGDTNRLNQVLAQRKGTPVWIDVYTNKQGFVNVASIGPRDSSITAQVGAQAQQIQQNLQDNVVTPTGAVQPAPRSY